jgi:protein SCO1/2
MFSRLAATALFLATTLVAGSVCANAKVEPERPILPGERLPKRLEGVDVNERLGERLSLNLGFKDSLGSDVMLRDYFKGDVPVIVTLNYSDCPVLCSMILNGLVESLKQVDLTLGKDFRIVTVSINPNEKPERAHATQERYLGQYGRPESRDGWQVLTGTKNNIKAVARSLGFSYNYNEKRDEYLHPSAFAIAAPDGKITRYIYGIEYLPDTVRLSLIEASEGKVGSPLDKLLLYCFHYDETEGRYAPVAMNIMRLGGGLAVILLGGFLTLMWRAEIRKKKLATSTAP